MEDLRLKIDLTHKLLENQLTKRLLFFQNPCF